MKKIKRMWGHVLVFFGFRVWAKMQYNRPSSARCAYHGCKMKRGRKTIQGALYWCPKCQSSYHLESGGNKLVPASVR